MRVNRTYPAVFQAWTPASDIPDSAARHELAFRGLDALGLKGDSPYPGLATRFTVDPRIRAQAPDSTLVGELRYRDARDGYLPADHPWWLRDDRGQRIKAPGKTGVNGQYYLLDYHRPEFREHLANQARAAVESGGVDGVMLDWWTHEDDDRVALVKTIRDALGDDGLIMVNSFNSRPERSKTFVNGIFMEGLGPKWGRDAWSRAEGNLCWAESQLKPPHINALEAWGPAEDARSMRAVTTLALTASDGYALYSLPNGQPGQSDHRHTWQPFWDKGLGQPLGPGSHTGPALRREFEHGSAVYNPPGAPPVKVAFSQPRLSRATGHLSCEHTVPSGDGDIFL